MWKLDKDVQMLVIDGQSKHYTKWFANTNAKKEKLIFLSIIF